MPINDLTGQLNTVGAKFKSTSRNSSAIGYEAESLACRFLIDQGMILVERNYRTRRGEIDLIMQSTNSVIFVEVKYRGNKKFGTAEESITKSKQKKIIAAAQAYLSRNGHSENTCIRFDAVIIGPSKNCQPSCTINWIQNILAP